MHICAYVASCFLDDSLPTTIQWYVYTSFSANGRTNERESLFLLSRRWRQFSLISALISENYDSTGRPTYRRRTFRTIIGFLITTLLPCTNDFALSLTVFRFENQPIDTINRMAFDSTSFVIYILVRTLWTFFLLIKYHFSLMFDVSRDSRIAYKYDNVRWSYLVFRPLASVNSEEIMIRYRCSQCTSKIYVCMYVFFNIDLPSLCTRNDIM